MPHANMLRRAAGAVFLAGATFAVRAGAPGDLPEMREAGNRQPFALVAERRLRPCRNAELDALAAELEPILARIVNDALNAP